MFECILDVQHSGAERNWRMRSRRSWFRLKRCSSILRVSQRTWFWRSDRSCCHKFLQHSDLHLQIQGTSHLGRTFNAGLWRWVLSTLISCLPSSIIANLMCTQSEPSIRVYQWQWMEVPFFPISILCGRARSLHTRDSSSITHARSSALVTAIHLDTMY